MFGYETTEACSQVENAEQKLWEWLSRRQHKNFEFAKARYVSEVFCENQITKNVKGHEEIIEEVQFDHQQSYL